MRKVGMSKATVTSQFAFVLFIALGSLWFGPTRLPSLAQGPPAARTQTQIEKPGTVRDKPASPAPYMPPACVGKPITIMSRAAMLAQTVSEVKPNPPITQSNQLKLFNALAKIVDEFYLYPGFKGLDWPNIVAESRGKVERGLDTENFYAEVPDEEWAKLVTDGAEQHDHYIYGSPL